MEKTCELGWWMVQMMDLPCRVSALKCRYRYTIVVVDVSHISFSSHAW